MNVTLLAPKAAALCEITRIGPFKVTQGHRVWWQSKARIRTDKVELKVWLLTNVQKIPSLQLRRKMASLKNSRKVRKITTEMLQSPRQQICCLRGWICSCLLQVHQRNCWQYCTLDQSVAWPIARQVRLRRRNRWTASTSCTALHLTSVVRSCRRLLG